MDHNIYKKASESENASYYLRSNSTLSKEKIIEYVKRELLHGQLKRNILVTQEIANLTKDNTLLDAEGLQILTYLEDILKDTSEDKRKSIKFY